MLSKHGSQPTWCLKIDPRKTICKSTSGESSSLNRTVSIAPLRLGLLIVKNYQGTSPIKLWTHYWRVSCFILAKKKRHTHTIYIYIYIWPCSMSLSEQLLDHSSITVNRIDSADKHWKYESSRQEKLFQWTIFESIESCLQQVHAIRFTLATNVHGFKTLSLWQHPNYKTQMTSMTTAQQVIYFLQIQQAIWKKILKYISCLGGSFNPSKRY